MRILRGGEVVLTAGFRLTVASRYAFKRLDRTDQPYVWFRFYYRSKEFIQRTCIGNWSLSQPIQIPRPLRGSLTRKPSSLCRSLARGKGYLADRLSRSRRSESTVADAAIGLDASSFAVSRIEAMIQGLEEDLATVTSTYREVLQTLHGKLDRFKRDAALQQRQPEGKKPAGGTAIATTERAAATTATAGIWIYRETATWKSARNRRA